MERKGKTRKTTMQPECSQLQIKNLPRGTPTDQFLHGKKYACSQS